MHLRGVGGRLQYFKCFKLQHFGDIFKDPERPGCELLGKKKFFSLNRIFILVSHSCFCWFYDKGL